MLKNYVSNLIISNNKNVSKISCVICIIDIMIYIFWHLNYCELNLGGISQNKSDCIFGLWTRGKHYFATRLSTISRLHINSHIDLRGQRKIRKSTETLHLNSIIVLFTILYINVFVGKKLNK